MEKEGPESHELTKDGAPNTGGAKKGRKRDHWRELCTTFFREEFSLHGVRYVFLQSPWFCRRFIWLCILVLATTIFIYLNTLNLMKYLSHPQAISMDLFVTKNIEFPAVTICNYNKHRFSRIADLGLFDTLYTQHDRKSTSQPTGKSWYRFRPDLCISKDEFSQQFEFSDQILGVSSLVCEETCSEYTMDESMRLCSGFWYDRSSHSCYLSESHEVHLKENNQMSKCEKESVEYYERQFIKETPSFRCTFDVSDCEEDIDINQKDPALSEKFVIANATKEFNDYTGLRSYRGRYLRLFETKRRPGYSSKFYTKLYTFENSCVEFYYRFLGEGVTSLSVSEYNIQESFKETDTLNGSASADWQRYFAKLHDGPGKLTIEAKRSEEHVTTGLLIDNFGINSCDKNKECIADKKGMGYEGNVSVTQSGMNCVVRSDAITHSESAFCRNPDGDEKPWCWIESDAKFEFCDIPRCACAEDEFLCQFHGACVPKSMTCDGHHDCDRFEDEELCESKAEVQCSFDNDFMCGYRGTQMETLAWRRKNAREILTLHKPQGDYRGRADEYFMYIDTQATEEGNDAIILSPPYIPNNNASNCVSFLMRSFSQFSLETKLMIYQMSGKPHASFYATRVLLAEFDLTVDAYSKWNEYTVSVPYSDKSVKLIWWYKTGLPHYSNIAIDEVTTKCSQPQINNVTQFQTRSSFICDFTKPDICDLSFMVATLKWAPHGVADYAFDNSTSRCPPNYALRGMIRTPYFPKEGPFPETCLGKIKGPEGTKIKLTFFNRNFKKSNNCTTNYLKLRLQNGEEQVLCDFEDQTNDTTLLIDVNEMELVAQGNIAFYCLYELVGDYKAYAILSMNNPDLQESYNFNNAAVTSTIQFNDNHCLTLDAITQKASIQINLHGYTELINLYEGNGKTILRQTIPAGVYAIGVFVPLVGERRVAAVIQNMKIEPGWCHILYGNGSVNCEFGDRGICGYLDFSQGNSKWERSSDGMVVQSKGDTKTATKANLVSPTFVTGKMACLQISISSANDTVLQVSVFGSSDIFDKSAAEFFEIIVPETKEQKFTIPVTDNAKRFMLTADQSDVSITLHSVMLVMDARACADTSLIIKMQGQIDSGLEKRMAVLSSQLGEEKPEEDKPATQIPETAKVSSPDTDEKNGSHFRRDFTAFFNVGDLHEATAHQLEDMVFSCKFNGEDCDMENDFTKQKTKYGVCYTFNSEQNGTTKETTLPGSEHGLQLVLNTETYEDMRGMKTDDGVKIHIHSPYDIPYVQYVGKAAALSQHTYFEITHHDMYSMTPPHGKCGSMELSLYPNQTYTRYRCNRQCETGVWQAVCGCIDHYMPGNGTYCTLPERKVCKEKINMKDVYSCSCPMACFTESYPVQSSSSSLSKFGVAEYLLQKDKIERIAERLEYSQKMGYQMRPFMYKGIKKSMQDLLSMLSSVPVYIKEQSFSRETSRFSLIQRGLLQFHIETKKDIQKLRAVLEKLTEEAKCMNRLNGVLNSSIEETLNNLAYLKFLFTTEDSLITTSKYAANDRKDIVVMKSRLIAEHFTSLSNMNFVSCHLGQSNPWLPSENQISMGRRFSGKMIDAERIKRDKVTLAKMSQALDIIIPDNGVTFEQYISDKTIMNALDQLYNYVHVNFTALLEETLHYTSILDDAMKVVMMESDVEHTTITNPDDQTEREILKETEQLQYSFMIFYIDCFEGGETSIVDLAKEVVDVQMSDAVVDRVSEMMKRSKALIQERILDGLNAEIHQHGPESTLSFYINTLTAIYRIYPYVSDLVKKNLTDTVRNMTIWRNPSADIDSDDYIEYDMDDRTFGFMWPSTLDLSEFFETKARGNLKKNIDSFYRQLGNELYKMENAMTKQMENFEKVSTNFNKTVNDILESLEVDEDLLLQNFLKVDVFYGDTVYHEIIASSAYTLYDFFNDIGGYFGLLLGASCITLIEFLDLIVYNVYLGLAQLRKGKMKHSEANGMDNTSV